MKEEEVVPGTPMLEETKSEEEHAEESSRLGKEDVRELMGWWRS